MTWARIAILVALAALTACQGDGYMGKMCEDRGLKEGTDEYERCVKQEARRNYYDTNVKIRGGP